MVLTIRRATLKDVPGMSRVDLLAFYPTSVIYRKLFPSAPNTTWDDKVNFESAQTYMSREIEAEGTGIEWTVVEDNGLIVAVGKWIFPDSSSTNEENSDGLWPSHFDVLQIDSFFASLVPNRNSYYGDEKYVVMQWICTLPGHERHGAASMILNWGLQKADRLGLATWIEATSYGLPLYKTFGWKEVGEFQVTHEGSSEKIITMSRPPQSRQ